MESGFLDDEHERIIKLPPRQDTFFGREDVLNTLKCDVEKNQFVVIHGGTCVGKSALSINFAHEVKEEFKCIIKIDMREMAFDNKFDKVFQKLCATILSELNIDISVIKEDERSAQLERRIRSYASQNQKTLILLDNADGFISSDELHSVKSKALKYLLLRISKNAENHVKIVASSRVKANEILFPKVRNINLLKFSEEDSKEFLERRLEVKKMKHIDLLVNKCQGVPYILKILALALNEITDEKEEADFVTCIQESRLEAAGVSYSYINQLFDISFQSLLKDEMDVEVAKALSVFPASFSFYLAKTLCDKLGMVVSKAAPSIKRLRDKGIIDKFDENGESLHPFMKEYIQTKKCSSNENRGYQIALITVYIDYLFKISQDSFNNDGGTECVLNFRRNGSILENLVCLLKRLFENSLIKNDVRKALERSFPNYFLLLRFLCYLVNEEAIAQLFTAFLNFVDGGVWFIITACLDELRWKGEVQSVYRSDYEFVMIERRLLSKQLNKYMSIDFRHQKNDVLQDRLEALLEKCTNLPDAKVRAYYMTKINKLLGQYHKEIGNTEKACEYFLESLKISRENFGDGFFTVDWNERYAVSLQIAGKFDEAGESFREAYEIAKRSKILMEQKLSNMLVSWGSFLLKCTAEKGEGLKILEQACRLQEKAGYFNKVIPKVMIAFGTHDLAKFKSEYTRLQNVGFISPMTIERFHLLLAENLLYIGRENKDTERSEEGFRIIQEVFELSCKDMKQEAAVNVNRIVLVLKKLIKYDLSKFKNAYIKLQKSGFFSSKGAVDFQLTLAEFLLFWSSNQNYDEQNEEGFRILQEAIELCSKDNNRQKADIMKKMVPFMQKLIEYDLCKFKNAYTLLQKSGFFASETILDLLLPLADCLLHNFTEGRDSEKSEQGFKLLQQAFELCDVRSQEQIFRVLDIASKYDISKLIDYMKEFKFTPSHTSSDDFYRFMKFHSLTAKDRKNEIFDRNLAEQKLKERLQVAIVATKILLKVRRSKHWNGAKHFENLCRLYKLIATESCHILTIDERRPFAKKSLHLIQSHSILFRERDVLSLENIVNDKSRLADQQYYKEVCFLSRMYDHMIRSGFGEQLEQTVHELKQHPRSKVPEIENKLSICLLAIPSVCESEEGLTLLEKVIVYIENVQEGHLDQSHFYDLRLLTVKFLESAADEKQRSVAKQLCVRVLRLLEKPSLRELRQFQAYREQFHALAYG
eukprot:Seg3107.1 transcript_id=Seg3107.1/GoldUCD/mRNA.D3Y31 product="hypothetical protein" protein_id=Seg3107.1/GoldUCD/D3Y31